MTDARFPSRWIFDKRFQQLGDHFWPYMVTLAWSAENRTDGVITDDDVALIPFVTHADVEAFLACKVWKHRRKSGWLIVDYDETQSTSVELAAIDRRRAKDRARKRKERAEGASKNHPATSTDDGCPPDSPADSPHENPHENPRRVHAPSPRPRTRTTARSERDQNSEVDEDDNEGEHITDDDNEDMAGEPEPVNGSPWSWSGGGSDPYEEYR